LLQLKAIAAGHTKIRLPRVHAAGDLMSKRTTRTDSSEPSTPAPRKRKASTSTEPVATAPKAPRLRKKTVEPLESAAPSNGHSATDVVVSETIAIVETEPSYEQIATRAYFIALERGFQTDPLSDWLLAERELRTSAGS
jgi:hypothetical protein